MKRLRFKRAQDWESPSTKRVSEGSNPASYPKTAVGIYGNFKKNSGSKNPERLDAVGFAPTASKVLGCYGASGDTELFEKNSNINGFGLSDNFFSCIAS